MKGSAALWLRLAALSMVLAFLLTVVWRRHAAAALAAWAICGLAVVDALTVNADLHPTIEASRLGPPEWVDVAGRRSADRVYVGGRLGVEGGNRVRDSELIDRPRLFHPPIEMTTQEALAIYSTRFAQVPAAWGIRELISYDLPQLWPREYVLMLRRFRDASPEERLRFLRRTGHRYCFVEHPPSPGAEPLSAPPIAAPVALYECGDAPQRLFVTTAARVEPDLARQIDLLFDESHDPYTTVLLERSVPLPHGGRTGAAAAAEIVRERHAEIVVRVRVPAGGGYLNVLDSYDRFWTVEVNGTAGTLLRANGLFRAVPLPPGTHDVRFAYRPVPFYAGAAITGVVGLLLIWCALARTRRLPIEAQPERA